MGWNCGAQPPPPTASGSRFAVIASHLSHSSLGMGEKEAAEPIGGPTIFDRIIRKEIPCQVVYEDQKLTKFENYVSSNVPP
ncbi:adenylylsulfatase HINT1-like [Phragmites australis]|uniref:adenylylsulfatase HINT1-like n=1 Tax=Phragmites australis TaxID=29695 RepID=UPI002D798F72|nr:adenylylsulfatase HINT1-like [Phragmites australis]